MALTSLVTGRKAALSARAKSVKSLRIEVIMKNVVILILVLVVTGCATAPKGNLYVAPNEISKDKATITFYRPSTFSLSARDVNIFLNDEPILLLSNGSYAQHEVSAGIYRFGAKIKPYGFGGEVGVSKEYFEFEYELRAGENYYVGWFSSLNSFVDTPEEYFEISSKINPDTPYFEGLLVDLNAEYGVVKPEYAIPELTKTKISLGKVDPSKI